MRFRFHRGGLDESLKTTTEVQNKEELLDHINAFDFCKIVEIKFEYYANDPRAWGDTWIVMKRMNGTDNWGVAGFSDGTFDR